MYNWIVFVHVLGVFGFLLAHGAAAVVSFKLRGEREVERVRALLDLSRSSTAIGSVSLLITLAAGISLGFMGHWWGQIWIWASLGLLVLIGISMNVLGTRSLNGIRQLVQANGSAAGAKKNTPSSPTVPAEQQLASMLAATHPWAMAITGGGGLALILWLMMFKPF
ncbi:MAG: hypothetical protein ACM3N4_10105 [Nitrososphaerota archaeon]